MAERTVLLDATAAVTEAHLDLIANGTVAVVSAADFPPGKYPTDSYHRRNKGLGHDGIPGRASRLSNPVSVVRLSRP